MKLWQFLPRPCGSTTTRPPHNMQPHSIHNSSHHYEYGNNLSLSSIPHEHLGQYSTWWDSHQWQKHYSCSSKPLTLQGWEPSMTDRAVATDWDRLHCCDRCHTCILSVNAHCWTSADAITAISFTLPEILEACDQTNWWTTDPADIAGSWYSIRQWLMPLCLHALLCWWWGQRCKCDWWLGSDRRATILPLNHNFVMNKKVGRHHLHLCDCKCFSAVLPHFLVVAQQPRNAPEPCWDF